MSETAVEQHTKSQYPKTGLIYDYKTPHYGLGYETDAETKDKALRRIAFCKRKEIRENNLAKSLSGVDDGKGAKNLLYSFVDSVIDGDTGSNSVHQTQLTKNITKDFSDSGFLTQLEHPQFNNIPLLSQVARQKGIWPQHSTEKRKKILQLCDRLKRNDGLFVRARLNSDGIDDMLLAQIANALRRNIYLQHLMLHDNAITDEGLISLKDAARWHPSLHTIWLGSNQISDVGVRHLCDLIRRNHNIKILNLSNKWPSKDNSWTDMQMSLHPHVTFIGAELIAKELKKCCGITSLCLSDQRIRDVGVSAIYDSLKYCDLRSLNVKGNEITDASCKKLQNVLTDTPKLEKLDLSRNSIQDDGAVCIAEGLRHNKMLQALNLAYNQIDNVGMNALCLVLEHNHIISTLLTIYNTSTDDRAERLVSLRTEMVYNIHTHSHRQQRDKPLTAAHELELRKGLNENMWNEDGLHDDILDSDSITAEYSPIRSQSRGHGLSYERMKSPFKENTTPLKSPAATGTGISGKRPVSRSITFLPDPLQLPGANQSSDFRMLTPKSPLRSSRTFSSDSGAAGGNALHPVWEDGLILENNISRPSTADSYNASVDDSVSTPTSSRRGSISSRTGSRRGGGTISKKTRARPISKPKLSSDIGRTLGIPTLTNMGVMPVRSATTKYRDSGQQLIYLRVSTPDDPPEARPYSLLQIEKDRKAERIRISLERQSDDYKEQKKNIIEFGPKIKTMKGDTKPPPGDFWDDWKLTIRQRYPKGIDNAVGCTSTKVGLDIGSDEMESMRLFNDMEAQLQMLKDKKHHSTDGSNTVVLSPIVKSKATLAKKMSAGQAFIIRKKLAEQNKARQMAKLNSYKGVELVNISKDNNKVQMREMMGLNSNEGFGDALNRGGGLTMRTNKERPVKKDIKNIWDRK